MVSILLGWTGPRTFLNLLSTSLGALYSWYLYSAPRDLSVVVVFCQKFSISPYFRATTNVLTAYLLYSLDEWKCPAIFLLVLTVFPVDSHKLIHNVFAYAFFISCFKPMFDHNRLQPYIVPYLLSLVILPKSFIFTEIVCILTLCLFHSHLLYLKYKVDNTRKNK